MCNYDTYRFVAGSNLFITTQSGVKKQFAQKNALDRQKCWSVVNGPALLTADPRGRTLMHKKLSGYFWFGVWLWCVISSRRFVSALSWIPAPWLACLQWLSGKRCRSLRPGPEQAPCIFRDLGLHEEGADGRKKPIDQCDLVCRCRGAGISTSENSLRNEPGRIAHSIYQRKREADNQKENQTIKKGKKYLKGFPILIIWYYQSPSLLNNDNQST